MRVHGTTAPGFEPVRRTFARNAFRGEWGGALSVWHDGRFVVDLWAGLSDQRRRTPWQPDTLATVFSSTKGLVALCFLMLADRGKLDYDAPVAEYWPEFAAADKGGITVRTLLNHRAGLIGLDRAVTLDTIEHHPDEVARVLAEQRPLWQPGSDQGYHGVTYGLYAAELFCRITGESPGAFLKREVAEPLAADVHLGLAAEHEHRVATNYPTTKAEFALLALPKLFVHRGTEGRVYRSAVFGGDASRAFAHPRELGPSGLHNFNTRRVHALELPWGNGIASARGLAKVYAGLANGGELDGVRLVSRAALEPIFARQSWSERDRVLCKALGWSQGFLKEETHLFSPNPESFGHPGAGGALGWCDPKARVAIGYVTGKMAHHIRSPRALALCRSIYRCLDAA